MRKSVVGAVVLVLSLSASAAVAATPYEKMKMKTKRFGVTSAEAFAGKQKSLCVCQEGVGAKDNTVGVIVWDTTVIDSRSYVTAQCRPVGYGVITGEPSFLVFCDDWVPLAK